MSQTTNSSSNPIRRFLAELLHRRVLQIGGAYVAGAWLSVEIFSFLFEQFQAPDWAIRLVAIVLVVGFPISMVLAWVVQVSEQGHWEMDHTRGDKKTLAVAITLGLLITAGLSWQILPQKAPPLVYKPMTDSLAVLPFTGTAETAVGQAQTGRFYHSLMQGLEQSPELTLVRLQHLVPSQDPVIYGRQLGVKYLASGHTQQSPEGVSTEVQMLDVKTGEVDWEQLYDGDSAQMTTVAVGVANDLLQAMTLPLLNERQFTGSDKNDAYQAWLDGSLLAANSDTDQLKEAARRFQTAIDIDPGYALAYLGLAQASYDLADTGDLKDSEREALEKRAQSAVRIARQLKPDSADAISLFARELENPQLRIQAWERALELDPDHVMSLYRYAVQLRKGGKLEEAERLIKRAIKLSPQNTRFQTELATILAP